MARTDQIRFFVEIDVPADKQIYSDENYDATMKAINESAENLAAQFGGTVRDVEIK